MNTERPIVAHSLIPQVYAPKRVTVKCPRCHNEFASIGVPEVTGDCKGRLHQCNDCGRMINK